MSLDAPGTIRLFAETGEWLHSGPQMVPKPSSDPEDPLNWSRFRKNLMLGSLIIYTFAMAFTATSLYSIFVPLSEVTGLTIDQLVVATGYSYWAIGIAAVVTQAVALAYGKRPVFVIAALASGLLNIWTVYANNNATWIISRLLIGATGGPGFCLVEVAIADAFFFHERAFPMGLYVFVLYLGALVGPMLSGFINDGLGWRAVLWFSIGLSLFSAVVCFFLLEETNFTREEPSLLPSEVSVPQPGAEPEFSDKKVDQVDTATHPATTLPEPAKWRGPHLWLSASPSPWARGVLWRGLVQPFALMRLPIVLWGGVVYGIYQVYFNFIGSLSSAILAAPPYNFSSGSVGLTFLGPLIGTTIGAVLGGWYVGRFTLTQAMKNGGISEPEHKLKLFVIPAILAPASLLMMGLGPYYGAHWIVYVLGETLDCIAGPIATLLVITYAFDCFHAIDPDDCSGPKGAAQDVAPYIIAIVFIGMSVTFAFGYAITPWSLGWNLKWFGVTSALSSVAVNASVLALLKWGKRLRQSGEAHYRKVVNW